MRVRILKQLQANQYEKTFYAKEGEPKKKAQYVPINGKFII